MNVWVAFLYLQLLDVLTTLLFTSAGMLGGDSVGVFEGNLIVRLSMIYFGRVWGLIIFKFVIISAVYYFYSRLASIEEKFANKTMVLASYFYMLVVIWNLSHIIRLFHL